MLLFTPLVQGLWTRTDQESRVHVAVDSTEMS